MRHRLLPVVAAIILVLLAAGCRQGPAPAPVHLGIGSDLHYNPSSLTVKVGQPVLLTIKNADYQLHDWAIDQIEATGTQAHGAARHEGTGRVPALHIAVGAGKSAQLEFTPTRAGTYAFYCTVPGHKEGGMQGTLIVQ